MSSGAEAQAPMVCRLCGCGYAEGEGRVHGRAWTCWACFGQSLEARGFSQEETHDFYRSLKEEKTDGRLTYKTLRAVLVKKLTERRIKRFASQVEVEWLPASVLLSRGWDQATLDRFEKEHGEEYGCDVYRVPTRKVTWSEVFESVQDQLLEQEKAISMTRAQAKKGEMDVPVTEATSAGQKGKTAEKAAEQAAKRMRTQNGKVAQEAGKWIAPLRKLPDALAKVVKQAQSAGDRYEGTKADLDLVEELQRKAQAWGDAASRTLLLDQQNKDAETAGLAVTPLGALPFSQQEAKTFQKQAQAASAAVRGNIRKKAPKPAAGQGEAGEVANPPAPKRRRTKGQA